VTSLAGSTDVSWVLSSFQYLISTLLQESVGKKRTELRVDWLKLFCGRNMDPIDQPGSFTP